MTCRCSIALLYHTPDTCRKHRTPQTSLKVLHYVAQGLTTKAISERLGIGPDGVNAHLRTIFAKLGVSSPSEAVAIALRKRLLKM